MTAEWLRSGLDIVLVLLIGVGIVQATRLIGHLAGLRASRAEMERFVRDFNASVLRAETGIKNLKTTARDIGDDLESLLGKSMMARDELRFLVESADQLATRLTDVASDAARGQPNAKAASKPAEPKAETKKPAASVAAESSNPAAAYVPPSLLDEPEAPKAAAPLTPIASRREPEPKPASRAEKELLQALKKLS